MVLNSTAQNFSSASLSDISYERNIVIQPAGYAFAIWGIIYTLVAIFAVYQALPQKWAGSRNNKLIFEEIGWIFSVNMVCNALWLVVFMTNTSTSFALAWVLIVGILATDMYILWKALRAKINVIEFIVLRIGFSIYSGWVTAATILNLSIFLQSVGMTNDQQTWGIIILWVAIVIYNIASFMERNPLYGIVFLWPLFAIIKEQEKMGRQDVVDALPAIILTHIGFLILTTSFCVFQKVKGKCERGLMY
jgi:benzodiazapine receptor